MQVVSVSISQYSGEHMARACVFFSTVNRSVNGQNLFSAPYNIWMPALNNVKYAKKNSNNTLKADAASMNPELCNMSDRQSSC